MTQNEDIKTINDKIPALKIEEIKTWDALKINDVAFSIRKLNNKQTIDAAYVKAEKKAEK